MPKKYILCKKIAGKFRIYDIQNDAKSCFDNKFIDKSLIYEMNLDNYISLNKDFMKDCNFKLQDMLKYDGLDQDFFNNFHVFEVYKFNKSTEYILFKKNKIDWNLLLKMISPEWVIKFDDIDLINSEEYINITEWR